MRSDLVARVEDCLGRLGTWDTGGGRFDAKIAVSLFGGDERVEVGGEECPGGMVIIVAVITL